MRLSLAVAVLVWPTCAFAQVSVVEPSIRAELVDGHTTISLPLTSGASKAVDVRIRLRWLSPSGKVGGEMARDVRISPGASTVSILHPLPEDCDPLAERLEYSVLPREQDYTAFVPIMGMLSFPNIADYAFTVGVLTAGIPRPDQPFDVRVLTANPLTGRPVSGVTVKAEGAEAATGEDGIAVLHVVRAADDHGSIDVTAQLGDFTANGKSMPLSNAADIIRGYTDKPIYQPGQTMHVRMLAVGGDRKVRAGEEYILRIVNESGDLMYSANVTTSRFGVASTDWIIPEDAESGRYAIQLKTEQTDSYPLRFVNIRRYELPSFRVTVRPDHPFYLSAQTARVEVRGEYLFGKPVSTGKVRIAAADDEEENLAEGALDRDGRFYANVNLEAKFDAWQKFEDRHFIAFLTDLSTNRTEQRKFDLRISRDPIHLYPVRLENDGLGRRVYVTTYSPDGSPLRSDVEVVKGEVVLGRGATNRFGLARIELGPGTRDDAGNDMEIRAVTADGLRARTELSLSVGRAGIWLKTGRSLYRAGQTVRCTIGSEVRDRQVLLIALNERGQVVFTKTALLKEGQAEIEIPYDKSFGRVLNIGVTSGGRSEMASRWVYFPGPGDFVVKASPFQATYRPGEMASIQFQASAEAALGIAIVDQSVSERAATDAAFGNRGWFESESDEAENLGGITAHDLMNLPPARIDQDLQLVAEVLAPGARQFIHRIEDPLDEIQRRFEAPAAKALAPVEAALDRVYLSTLEYPRDETSFQRSAGAVFAGVRDPWLQPFVTKFSIEGQHAVLRFLSDGPDKKPGTPDDFTAMTVRRNWFLEYASLMRGVLERCTDYPASPAEFLRLLENAGIRFDALRDPWGSALQVKIAERQRSRVVTILSVGPDLAPGTADDFTVTSFSGPYFAATEASINSILGATPEFPGTVEAFHALLAKSGLELDSLRDPWGHSFYLAVREDERFTDQVQLYTYAEFNGIAENRKQTTPVKQRTRTLEIRSLGTDGLKGTYDDFALASFVRVVRTPLAPTETKLEGDDAPPAVMRAGTGTIAGVVTDLTGGVVNGVEVTLNDIYIARTDSRGEFAFRGLPAGRYRLRCTASGFRANVLEGIPVADGHVTRTNLVLQVGDVTESVSVEAQASQLNMEMAETRSTASAALSTPRVREYFPETLYWQPELVTDSQGRASVRVKLADSVTTWHVAVIGSTEDGRIAKGSVDIRAFQPFQVDLDVPRILTAGDEISLPVPVRNYLARAQKITVTAKVAPELRLMGEVRQPGVVTPSASGNAVMTLRADGVAKSARLRVTAVGSSASDAIEKPVGIHPDGERRSLAVSSVVARGQPLSLTIGAGSIAGSIQGAVKIYPSLLARILESIEVLLERPHGCGEQTISSAYPNLLLLKALKDAGLSDGPLTARATRNLLAGYQRLLRYQDADGGFTYWGRGDADVALTSYALTFLDDAKEFIAVDEDRLKNALQWLAAHRDEGAAADALRMRAVAHGHPDDAADLDEQLGAMARKAAEFGDPYAMAAYALAALEANKSKLAGPVVEQLVRIAQDERGAAYWALRTNTPFHGWGRSGQVETTALVVSALAGWRKAGHGNPELDTLIDRGSLFLLQNSDAGGGWSTSRSTVSALMALLDTWSQDKGKKAAQIEVRVNGVSGGKVLVPEGASVGAPLVVDISRLLHAGRNEVTLSGFEAHAQQVQLTAGWYETWGQRRRAKDLDMEVRYNSLTAAVNDPVSCEVVISRPSFRGYGMMIATVGVPPGAEVDRGLLQGLVEDQKSGVDAYEVEPDHVTFYVWPRAADVKFRFVFRPRYAMKARAAQSVLYDYYNPDERAVLPPPTFVVAR